MMDVRVEVFSKEKFDGDWPKENAVEFLEWFKDKIDSIPDQFKGSARIEIDSEPGHEGEHYASIEIYYTRPESNKEQSSRERAKKEREEWTATQEKIELGRLLRKYGSSDYPKG